VIDRGMNELNEKLDENIRPKPGMAKNVKEVVFSFQYL